MRYSSRETSLLLALLFNRGGVPRARLSETTIRKLSGRTRLRNAFKTELRDNLDDLGFAFLEIDRGFAMIPLSALNGAPSITAKKHLTDIAANINKGGKIDFKKIEGELELDGNEASHDDE